VAGGATVPTTISQEDDLRPGGELPVPVLPNQLAADGSSETDGGIPDIVWILLALVVVVAAVAGPWAVRRVRRRRRRARGPVEQVAAAWDRARSAAVDAGVPGTPAMTGTEWAAATARVLPVAARPMGALAEVVDLMIFARPDEVDLQRRGAFGDSLGDDCDLWADQIHRFTIDNLPTAKRVQRYFTDLR
jgi:hypothetical protein